MGNKSKKKFYKRWWFWVLAIIIVFGAIGSIGDKDEAKVDTKAKPATTDVAKEDAPKAEEKKEEKKEESKINYDNFLKIKMDSKYADVVALIGEGTELSSSEVGGIKTVMYTWNGDGISNMNVTTQNGAVMSKAQLGLSNIDAKVTLEKYNKVKEGMSYNEVKSILGDGQIMSQSKIMDMESVMYSWANKDASNMNCTFSGDKMSLKAQFNLK